MLPQHLPDLRRGPAGSTEHLAPSQAYGRPSCDEDVEVAFQVVVPLLGFAVMASVQLDHHLVEIDVAVGDPVGLS
ncbi:UNVERIFIED_CONTAM: hypothetical protein LK11_32565, partial [Mumia flava]